MFKSLYFKIVLILLFKTIIQLIIANTPLFKEAYSKLKTIGWLYIF